MKRGASARSTRGPPEISRRENIFCFYVCEGSPSAREVPVKEGEGGVGCCQPKRSCADAQNSAAVPFVPPRCLAFSLFATVRRGRSGLPFLLSSSSSSSASSLGGAKGSSLDDERQRERKRERERERERAKKGPKGESISLRCLFVRLDRTSTRLRFALRSGPGINLSSNLVD